MFVGIGLNLVRGGGSASPASLFAAAEPGTWYDPSQITTLFQDNAGTTPVTAPNQTVGLMLDKSKGLVLGSELQSAGVVGLIGTATAATYNTSNGAGSITRVDASNQSFVQWSGLTSSYYKITVSCTAGVGITVRSGSQAGSGTVLLLGETKTFYALAGSGLFTITSSSATASFTLTSMRELAGNHATQATSTQRPIYGINPITGTRNLLTFTEQFDNAGWQKNSATITANTTTAPDGTTTADKLVDAVSAATEHYIGSSTNFNTVLTDNTVYTLSLYAKAAEYSTIVFSCRRKDSSFVSATFNLISGVISGIGNAVTTSATNVGNGWWRCVVAFNAMSGAGGVYPSFAATFATIIGDGTSGVYIWGAQLEVGSTATAYQKVVSQYEVTQAGVASASYLAFDGVDDGMVTNTITPAIDKAQMFAGVRKLSDTAFQTIAETSTIPDSSNGSVALGASTLTGDASRRTWSFASAGSIFRISGAGVYAAPISSVLTGVGDIATDTSILRVNGTQVANNTGDQGTGNYLAYPLYIGRRGGTSNPYNGRIYSLIVRFGPNLTTGQITSTESWVNGKTGAY
jgi:hypothetical protein